MLAIFSTPKAFRGHIAVIQRNALESWKRLHADVQVILFGKDEGTAEVCQELGLQHEAEVERSRLGLCRVDAMFKRAEELSKFDVLCYANCDIVLTRDFVGALQRVLKWRSEFLMVGRRWDTDITERIDFSAGEWQERIVERAKKEGIQRFFHNIDYFAFTQGLYQEIPGLVVGRVWWDHWMMWNALARKKAVVDASETVCAVHQNHDYGHVAEGWKSVSSDEDAQRNYELAGGKKHLRTIEDATFRLTRKGVETNRFHWLAPAKRRWRDVKRKVGGVWRTRVWHPLMDATRPLRHAVGLDKGALPGSLRKGERRHGMDQ
ncbi:MAG: hypothetical protein ACRD36_00500 [Candidatus Acidiferrum sp.]